MGKRKHLGLFFTYNENWIGGTYYIVNLIHALNILPDKVKPIISIISHEKSNFDYIKNETKYHDLFYIKDKSRESLLIKAVNAISLRLQKRKIINPKLPNIFDLVFPNPVGDYFNLIDENKKVYWISDFQESYLPEFFNIDELIEIKQRKIVQVYKAKKIVLSSLDSKQDFLKFYPENRSKVYVIPFSVTHPNLTNVKFDHIAAKYSIDRPYYFSPNQFWLHKNQTVVINAVKQLVEKGINILILFSGKENDYRHPEYTVYLKKMVLDYGLQNNIKFLGFIDRKEQLTIMKNAQSIIQPSLFEGWSTVIEDAKALNKRIIVSELRVHKEQLPDSESYIFFDPHSEEDLVAAITKIENNNLEEPFIDYYQNKLAHAKAFYELFSEPEN